MRRMHLGYKLKGFYKMAGLAAKEKRKILEFWWKYGLPAIQEAYGVSRSTDVSLAFIIPEVWYGRITS